MEKKTYKTPCMKVREISAHVMLNTSGGEKSLNMINSDVDEEYSQW